MALKILLITPPFTQLNTPYPASPYLKGFLKLHGYDAFQADLSIDVMNSIFSRTGFQKLFDHFSAAKKQLSPNSNRILLNKQYYLETVDLVMAFLQYRDNTLAQRICSDHFLPRASRFDQLPDLEWSFGSLGVNDKARFLATLYVEDMGDLIKDGITPYFGFSRYAEKLGMSAHSFSPIDQALQQPENIIETRMLELLKALLEKHRPDVVGLTIPFPGNLYAALKCGQYIKRNFQQIKIVVGGGYVNTELRELAEPAVFDYLDFITLDDGERPLLDILEFLQGNKKVGGLTRTFMRIDNEVIHINREQDACVSHKDIGCPDYSDLALDKYLSLIDLANPMHRLWSDGRWNKLTIAHGCYWHKCSFCDTSLDYIHRFDTASATILVDRIERLIDQTGQTGFHFVDEAAPPAALKELALELLRRKISISWWTNIRFETAFTGDLCRLLAASGCIAVTGGLETASDRLLTLMNKGVTVRQAAEVCRNLNNAGIMVHAYLMYGFPTQTAQETVDSLEVVRQFFEQGLIQSAFWHQFTATVHSDVGQNPEKYHCRIVGPPTGGFAKNDLQHEDPSGCDHQAFTQGLNKAVYNFMHGIGMDHPIADWFTFKAPALSVKRNYVEQAIGQHAAPDSERMSARMLWVENKPQYLRSAATKKGKEAGESRFELNNRMERSTVITAPDTGEWLHDMFDRFTLLNRELMSLEELKQSYETRFPSPFGSFLRSDAWRTLREKGLLLL